MVREGWKMPTTGLQVRGRQTLETGKDKKSFVFLLGVAQW